MAFPPFVTDFKPDELAKYQGRRNGTKMKALAKMCFVATALIYLWHHAWSPKHKQGDTSLGM